MIVFSLLETVFPVGGLLKLIDSFSSESVRGDESLDSWGLLSLLSGSRGESSSDDGLLDQHVVFVFGLLDCEQFSNLVYSLWSQS